MKLKRTLLWARLRSLWMYVRLTLKRMAFYLPVIDPTATFYLRTEVIYPSDLSDEEASFFLKRLRKNELTKRLRCYYTEYTKRVPEDPLWTVDVLFVLDTPFCHVQYHPAEECKEEDYWTLSLLEAPNR